MLKIGKNWGKIANYPLNAQQRSAPLVKSSLNRKLVLLTSPNFEKRLHRLANRNLLARSATSTTFVTAKAALRFNFLL